MPERKSFFGEGTIGAGCRSSRARSRSEAADHALAKKMAPENRGQVWEERLGLNPVALRGFPAFARPAGLEPRIRKITVADRDGRVSHQQAIDGGHHAAKQRRRRHEPERGGLGHDRPLLAIQRVAAVLMKAI
jgi:hypothetical protein